MCSTSEVLTPEVELLQICRRVTEGQLASDAAYNIIRTLMVRFFPIHLGVSYIYSLFQYLGVIIVYIARKLEIMPGYRSLVT